MIRTAKIYGQRNVKNTVRFSCLSSFRHSLSTDAGSSLCLQHDIFPATITAKLFVQIMHYRSPETCFVHSGAAFINNELKKICARIFSDLEQVHAE
jgi:hypothetical protein